MSSWYKASRHQLAPQPTASAARPLYSPSSQQRGKLASWPSVCPVRHDFFFLHFVSRTTFLVWFQACFLHQSFSSCSAQCACSQDCYFYFGSKSFLHFSNLTLLSRPSAMELFSSNVPSQLVKMKSSHLYCSKAPLPDIWVSSLIFSESHPQVP